MPIKELIQAQLDLLIHWQVFHLRIKVLEDSQSTDHFDHFEEFGSEVLVTFGDFVGDDKLRHTVDVVEVLE